MAVAVDEAKRAHTDRMIAETLRNRQSRDQGYREQALKIYPWICGRCAREFTRENLQQLTVHHRDHNHDNNPGNGSNWELLCLYCHDNEHSRELDAKAAHQAGVSAPGKASDVRATAQPFANLKDLLGKSGR
jgi:5-methylcytosine-specific restriction endonuclease McrA